MIDVDNSKTGRIADATFDQRIFGEDPLMKALDEQLDEARKQYINRKKAVILKEFRAAVAEFREAFHQDPTLVLMAYNDLQYLVEMYNEENTKLETGIGYVSMYGDDTKYVDEIKVRQGCDQASGKIKLYQLE